jgi:3-oxoacyl-[acyl-carrier protein] reductase
MKSNDKNYLLITGASRGIGFSIAETFLQHDWQVINLSRSAHTNIHVKNIAIDFSELDLLNEKMLSLQDCLANADKICLVHNAFYYQRDRIDDLNNQSFETALRINLLAPNLINQYCIPLMNAGSSIIYIGSTLAEKAVPNAASYVIAKHALVGMMRATCQDLGAQKIHTCCVSPGFTDTEMLRSHMGTDPTVIAAIAQRVGANRLIQPQEIADLAWFCANNAVINGSVIHANLGQIEQ